MGALFERTAVRDWRILAALFFSSTFLEFVGQLQLAAFRPLFLQNELHMAPTSVGAWSGFLASATALVAFPIAPFWGSVAERYSRKLVIVRAQYIEAIGYSLCGLAPNLGVFLVAHLLLGLTFGNIAVVVATQTLLTPERRVGTGISIIQTAQPVAATLGPPLGAVLIPHLGLRQLLVMDGIGCLIAGLLVTIFMPEPPGRNTSTPVLANVRQTLRLVWQRPPVRWNFIAWFLSRGAWGLVDTYLPVRITQIAPNPAATIGVILGIGGAVTTLVTLVSGRLVDRFGAARLYWPAMLVGAGVVTGMAMAPWVWVIALCAWLRSIPLAFSSAGLYTHLAQVMPRAERPLVISLTPLPRNISQFSLPLLGGMLALVSTPAALGAGAISYLLAALGGVAMLRATRRYLAAGSSGGTPTTTSEAPLEGAPR